MNLFGDSIGDRRDIYFLCISSKMLKMQFEETIDYLNSISVDDQSFPALIDTTSFKHYAILNGKFIVKNNLLDIVTLKILTVIEKINMQLNAYLTTSNIQVKKNVKSMISMGVLADEQSKVPKLLDEVIGKCNEYIDKIS